MPFIGNKPTAVPLSADDLEDNIITSAKIVDGTIATADIADANVTAAKLASGTVQNQSAFKNIIINGDMSIAQRGTSTSGVTTTDGYYACDRWFSQTDTGTWNISQSTDVPSGQGFAKSLKLDCTSAGTSNADEVGIRHKIEGQFLQYLKYGTSSADSLTLSFWIKTNLTGTYTVAFKNVSSVQERIVSFEYTVNSANTWEKKTITLPGDTSQALENTNTEELTIFWYFSAAFGSGVTNTWQNYSSGYLSNGSLPGLGGSTDDEVYITGVQLEAGTTASDFEFLPYDINLMRCERYYKKVLIMDGYGGQVIARTSLAAGATEFQVPISGQPMRTNPTASIISAGTPDIRVTKTLGSGTGAAFDGGNLTLNTVVSSDMTGKVIRVRGGAGNPDGSSDGAAIAIYNNGNTANAECDAEL
jgi:hypothetical protein